MKKQFTKLVIQKQSVVKFNFSIIDIINTAIGEGGDDNKTLNSTRI